MKVCPLAADSLGVRSVATYVECGATRVLIDPGASLAPDRFGLPPTEAEWEALRRANDRIAAYAGRADLVFVSHYHEDHFRYDPGLYEGRLVWAKDPRRMVQPRQRARAETLGKAIERRCRLEAADGRRLETPDALLVASPPLPHGLERSGLGYVLALSVTDRRSGERFVHASDVQGPLSAVAAGWIVRERPSLLYLSGPPGYLESRVGAAAIAQGIEHLLRIVDACGCRVIVDHHAVRESRYRERLARLWETGRVGTAAEFLGVPEAPLEARRAVLTGAQRKPPAAAPRRLKAPGGSGSMGGRWHRRAQGGTPE